MKSNTEIKKSSKGEQNNNNNKNDKLRNSGIKINSSKEINKSNINDLSKKSLKSNELNFIERFSPSPIPQNPLHNSNIILEDKKRMNSNKNCVLFNDIKNKIIPEYSPLTPQLLPKEHKYLKKKNFPSKEEVCRGNPGYSQKISIPSTSPIIQYYNMDTMLNKDFGFSLEPKANNNIGETPSHLSNFSQSDMFNCSPSEFFNRGTNNETGKNLDGFAIADQEGDEEKNKIGKEEGDELYTVQVDSGNPEKNFIDDNNMILNRINEMRHKKTKDKNKSNPNQKQKKNQINKKKSDINEGQKGIKINIDTLEEKNNNSPPSSIFDNILNINKNLNISKEEIDIKTSNQNLENKSKKNPDSSSNYLISPEISKNIEEYIDKYDLESPIIPTKDINKELPESQNKKITEANKENNEISNNKVNFINNNNNEKIRNNINNNLNNKNNDEINNNKNLNYINGMNISCTNLNINNFTNLNPNLQNNNFYDQNQNPQLLYYLQNNNNMKYNKNFGQNKNINSEDNYKFNNNLNNFQNINNYPNDIYNNDIQRMKYINNINQLNGINNSSINNYYPHNYSYQYSYYPNNINNNYQFQMNNEQKNNKNYVNNNQNNNMYNNEQKRKKIKKLDSSLYMDKPLSYLAQNINLFGRDQAACRYIQKLLDQNTMEFLGYLYIPLCKNILMLINDPFGNYLIQKIIIYLNEDQLLEILKLISSNFFEICCNNHGTRVLQSLIDYTRSPKVVNLLFQLFKPLITQLLKELNGTFVLQKFAEVHKEYSNEINEIIVESSPVLSTHRHGCCVIQKYLELKDPAITPYLLDKLIDNCLLLIVDQFGNYVIQTILLMGNKIYGNKLARKIAENVVYYAKHKYSSNVVEKCFDRCDGKDLSNLMSNVQKKENLADLILDEHGNYVVQKVLSLSDENTRRTMLKQIVPLFDKLKNFPYGEKVIARLRASYPMINNIKFMEDQK